MISQVRASVNPTSGFREWKKYQHVTVHLSLSLCIVEKRLIRAENGGHFTSLSYPHPLKRESAVSRFIDVSIGLVTGPKSARRAKLELLCGAFQVGLSELQLSTPSATRFKIGSGIFVARKFAA